MKIQIEVVIHEDGYPGDDCISTERRGSITVGGMAEPRDASEPSYIDAAQKLARRLVLSAGFAHSSKLCRCRSGRALAREEEERS